MTLKRKVDSIYVVHLFYLYGTREPYNVNRRKLIKALAPINQPAVSRDHVTDGTWRMAQMPQNASRKLGHDVS